MSKDQKRIKSAHAGERIAKVMARVGLCSRRDAEIWIAHGRVSVNGNTLKSAAVNVDNKDIVLVDGQPLPEKQLSRVWLYYKPKGLMTTSYDPEGRATVFENLPADMPRVISIGRLDLNSEGLLLLTNDGELARKLELPTTAWIRRYRVRVNGRFDPKLLDGLKDGIEIDGVRYGPIIAAFDRQQGANAWLNMALTEGKNREIRRICQHFGWPVSRLIRVGYGPFQLGEMEPGQVQEVKGKQLKEQLQFGNDYRPVDKADPEKAARESENRRTARGERPALDKGPDKRTREKLAGVKSGARSERTDHADQAAKPARDQRPSRGDRPARDEAPARNQRPGRNERMARAEGAPVRFERPVRGDKPSWDSKPARPGARPEKMARPPRADHVERVAREDRPNFDRGPAAHDRNDRLRDGRSHESRSHDSRSRDAQPRDTRAPRAERSSPGGKPSWADKPRRDDRADRPDRGERPAYAKRPSRDDRPARDERPSRNERPARTERPERDERPRRNANMAQDAKPSWSKRPDRDEQPVRQERARRNDRGARNEQAARSDAPVRATKPGLKSGWAKNKPSKPQPGTGRKPDRDRATKDERYARSERPTREERSRQDSKPAPKKAWGDKPRTDKPRSDKPRSDRPTGDRPIGDKPRGKSGSGKSGSGKPGSGNARRFR